MKRSILHKCVISLMLPLMAIFVFAFFLLFGFPAPASSEEIYRFERMWPTLQQPWYFSFPRGIAVDVRGYVYVVDTDYARIQKFTSDGQYVTKWGSQGTENGQFVDPHGIAVDSSGYVYVADFSNARIQKFTSDGRFVKKWGSYGSGSGQFMGPSGVAVDALGNVYVTDSYNYRIQKFDSEANYLTQWGSQGTGDGQFGNNFEGIAVDSNGNVYVADNGNNRVQKFRPAQGGLSYVFDRKWGSQGSANGQFQGLFGIAVDASGYAYVTDYGNDRIQKFDQYGNYVWQRGGFGFSVGLFYRPYSISVDAGGYIYVSEQFNSRIQKFTPDGWYVAHWGSKGNSDGQLNYPYGIALEIKEDGSSNVFVADTYNNRIQKFDSNGNYLTQWFLGQSAYITGIAVDNSGHVYVTDTTDNRIQKFKPVADGSGGFNYVLDKTWGSPGSGDGELGGPSGLAVDSVGNVYVAEAGNCRVQKFKPVADGSGGFDYVFDKKWGSHGWLVDGEFWSPHGIALDANGNVYVGDYPRIQKFKPVADGSGGFDYVFDRAMGSEGLGDGQFGGGASWQIIFGLTVDNTSGAVYAVDMWLGRIQKFKPDPSGNYIFDTKWGIKGSGAGQFNVPMGIASSPSGFFYVTESGNNRVQVFQEVTTGSNNKAIIVAGGGPYPGNDLWDSTQMSANFAYRTLTYQGYTKENIHYLSNNTTLDLDDDGLSDVAGDATNANLRSAITWAYGADDVLVYLVDHGGSDTFRMSGNETLSSAQFSSWLNDLQNNITGKVIIIYDACQSGSFVNDLVPLPGKTRIVITSTSPGESAYFVTQGSVSFSSYFWTHVFNGVSIKDSFTLARDAMAYTTPYQHPMLDANGNGVANEQADYDLVASTYIGNGTVIQGRAPVITTFSDPQTITNTSSASLYVDNLTDTDGIARVWAVIRPPDYNQGGSDYTVQNLPTIDLMPGVGGHQYGATYSAFNIPGTYQVAIYAMDRAGNVSVPKITTVNVNNPLRRKAILVAGGYQGDTLWPAIETNVKLAYDALRFQGYTDNDLYLLSHDSISGVTKQIDGWPTVSNVGYAVTNWAMSNTQDVALYMIGRGNGGVFNMSDAEILNATDLKGWLDTLQGTIPGAVTVVYDAPLSGSFLPLLIPPSNKTRFVLTSTGAAQPVYFLSNGNISFSRYFWNGVSKGSNLRDTYIDAKKSMGFLAPGQTPLLDDNGDGLHDNRDGSIAMNYKLGFGITLGADEPLIGSVSPPETLNGQISTTIWAKDVTTTGAIASVWAVLTPPGSTQHGISDPITQAQFVQLSNYDAVNNRYWGTYDRALTSGQYNISIFAIDTQSNVSPPSTTTVTQMVGPDRYEMDDTWQQAKVIVVNDQNPDTSIPGYEKSQSHTFHVAGDQDWVKFAAIAGQIYRITVVNNPGPNCFPAIHLYGTDGTTSLGYVQATGPGQGVYLDWTCPADGIYYAMVSQAPGYGNVYGAGTDYQLMLTIPAATFNGWILGTITPAVSLAEIKTNLPASALSLPNGMFFMPHIAGSFTLTVNASGYPAYTTPITVPELQTASVNVVFPLLFYGDFAGAGIWKWNGSAWIQLNGTNPSKMVATGSLLYATFTGYGIHEYNGSTWSQLNTTDPTDIVASGNMLFAKFALYGLHQWNGISWSQINTLTPTSMVAIGSVLYAHFNPYGIHKWDGSSWVSITASNPTSMVASDTTLYATFSGSSGIWKWDGSAWIQLNGTNPSKMVATGSLLYATFTGYGIHEYNGSTWSQLNTTDPTDIVASGNTLFAKFALYGLHQWNGISWSQINTLTPTNMVAIGSVLYAHFNPYGIHKWDGSSWNQINSANPTIMVVDAGN